MKLAVVVPAYNAAHVLHATVPAMLAQDEPATWVFVDDGSTDGTGAAIQALIDAVPAAPGAEARVVRLPENAGRAGARMAGIRAVPDADVLVMLDVDAAPCRGLLRVVRQEHEAGAIATMSRIRYAGLSDSEPYGKYLVASVRGPAETCGPLPWRYFLTTACSVRRQAFERAGGFRTDLTYGEDLDLATRLAAQHPDGLRLAGSIRLHDNRDLEGALRVVREFGERNLPRMIQADPAVVDVGGLHFLVAKRLRSKGARALVRALGPVADRLLPILPDRLVPYAVRGVLAAELLSAFDSGRRATAVR